MSESNQIIEIANQLPSHASYRLHKNGSSFVCHKYERRLLSLAEYIDLITKIHEEKLDWHIEESKLRVCDRLFEVRLRTTIH